MVRQTDGAFALKDSSLAPYQSLVQKLCDEIDVELTHVNRSTNRHADSLATLASKIKFELDTCCDSRTKAISVVSAHGQERIEVLH